MSETLEGRVGHGPEHTQRVLDLFLELVRLNSPPCREGIMMARLGPELEAMGCRVVYDQAGETVDGDTGNLIATLPANKPGASAIFLSAHVDTVAPTAGIQTRIEDGIVKTDGTTILGADDKAAVAAIVEAIRTVSTHDLPHGDVQVLLSICEEVGLKGAKGMDLSLVTAPLGFVFDSGQPVAGIVVQSPTHDKIHAVIHGKKAHAGAAPEKGVSAIVAAAAGIARMKTGRIDPETTANIGTVQGGEATNVVADRVELHAEARSRNEASLNAQVEHMVESLIKGAEERGGRAEIEVTRHYSTFHLNKTDRVVEMAAGAARRMGREPQYLASGGGSDANVFNARGLPAVVLGLGYQNIHTYDECIAIEDLAATYHLALALIQEAAES